MLDPDLLRTNPEAVRASLTNRGAEVDLDALIAKDEAYRAKLRDLEDLQAESNLLSKKIPALEKGSVEQNEALAAAKDLSARTKALKEEVDVLREEFVTAMLYVPNVLDDSVPPGGKDESVEVRSIGEPTVLTFPPKPHEEIGAARGVFDFERARKMSGARFTALADTGAKLMRALITYLLETHSARGYKEWWVPYLVQAHALRGTGQLPKFEEDLFKAGESHYLIPTAEVPLTNLHADEILPGEELPLKYTAYTPCFRSEAGSYGKDTSGLIRQHQFDKVELVKFCRPEESAAELESLTADAEYVLRDLGLPYRVVVLCTGDTGFAAAKTYDLEVWFPSQGKYREISSCSMFGDFQARRAGIRYRDADGKTRYVHTLNGSGVAIGRLLAAILENCQQEDGSVRVPEKLVPYLGRETL